MKKLIYSIVLFSIVMFTSSCSLIPRMTFDTKGSTPQQTQKSKAKEVCKGKVEFYEDGSVKSCSKGYTNYSENYEKKERRFTFTEKIKNFINKLVGFGFWGLVLLVIFVPGLFGVLIGKFVEGTIGVGTKTLKGVVRAVQRARKSDKPLDEALDAQLDEKYKKYIRELKDKERIK